MVHQGVGDWQFSGVYWSTFDADERKRLRFQLTCTWTCSKMVNETESLQVRIEEKHRAGHWLSCPFHAKSDIWYTCWYRYITAIEISLTSGFSLIIIMVHSSSSLHLHCPPCSLTTVSLFVIFYWKLCIIHFQSLFTLWKFQLDSIFRLGKVSFFQNWWIFCLRKCWNFISLQQMNQRYFNLH